ncbi:MAG: hypothetical protein QNI88_12955 [Desulfobacterales bacterium]|nr:hypothetical protein [Desulfobacterales bacterium]
MKRDTLYDPPRQAIPAYEFDGPVESVFDDMIRRSVPLYNEIIRREAQLIYDLYPRGTRIYDLGCSTANLAVHLPPDGPARVGYRVEQRLLEGIPKLGFWVQVSR